MKSRILPFFFLLALAWNAVAATFTASERPVHPATWPPGAYDTLEVVFRLHDAPSNARALYCDLHLPDTRNVGTFSTPITPDGTAAFLFDGGFLRSYEQEGALLLDKLRILTDTGFLPLPGSHATGDFIPGMFRPSCQSTLLTAKNGIRATISDGELSVLFTCPEGSDVLPEFFYRDDCCFDGFAVAIDKRATGIGFSPEAEGFFSTDTYIALDASSQGFQYLTETGDRDGNLSPGETLQLAVPVVKTPSPEPPAQPQEEFVSLLLFYHCVSDRQDETGAIRIHPFDLNRDIHLSQEELDYGRGLWEANETDHQALLEAVEICGAVAYEYDYYTNHYYPISYNH